MTTNSNARQITFKFTRKINNPPPPVNLNCFKDMWRIFFSIAPFLTAKSYPSFQIPSIRSKMRSYGHIIMAQDKGIRFPPKHHDLAALIHACVTILVSSSSNYLWYIWSSKSISICFQIRYMMHVFIPLRSRKCWYFTSSSLSCALLS